MNNKQVLAFLASNNIHCQLRPDFQYLTGFTQELGQVMCVELPTQAGQRASGISFWFHAGADFVFLGLWSGVLYQLARPSQLANLTADLLSGRYVKRGEIPCRIPEDLIAEYDLQQCEVVEIAPQTSHDQLKDAKASDAFWTMNASEIADALRPSTDYCSTMSDRVVDVRLGEARFLLRVGWAAGGKRAFAGALAYPELCATSDHLLVLDLFVQQLNCALYDPIWGNRIHLDDPYYTVLDKTLRPGFPRNVVDQDLE